MILHAHAPTSLASEAVALQIAATVNIVVRSKIAAALRFRKIQKAFGYNQIPIFRISGDEDLLRWPQWYEVEICARGAGVNNGLFIIS